MAKPFFEVFPTLKVGEETKNLLSEVEVTRVSTNTRKDILARLHSGKTADPEKEDLSVRDRDQKAAFSDQGYDNQIY